MASILDPQFDQLIKQYLESDCDPEFLYPGSYENIIKELKAWVVHRKEANKELMEVRNQSQQRFKRVMEFPDTILEPGCLEAILSTFARIGTLTHEDNKDCKRAVYLLHSLIDRGFTWPELWWRPETYGAVCSSLGVADRSFDAHATLTILENREEEERLRASEVEMAPLVTAQFLAAKEKFGHDFDNEEMMREILVKMEESIRALRGEQMPAERGESSNPSGNHPGGEDKSSGQEARVEDTKQTEAKAEDGKGTKK